MVLEMFMESLFAIVDVFWVSRLGGDGVAVVGLTESVLTFIYAIALGVSIAATAIISRRIGERNPERAAQSAAQIVMVGLGDILRTRARTWVLRDRHSGMVGREPLGGGPWGGLCAPHVSVRT
jgi:MatE